MRKLAMQTCTRRGMFSADTDPDLQILCRQLVSLGKIIDATEGFVQDKIKNDSSNSIIRNGTHK